MMRCIDHPSMLKDGAGWGSFVGLLSANLAGAGFTGAPATLVSGDQQASLWSDLGNRWRVRELYYKPYACCRWAQPSVAAALRLKAEHSFELEDIQSVLVSTFSEAARLTVSRPQDTEQAQYSLPYAMAAALKSGRLGPEEVRGKALGDLQVLGLAERVRVAVDAGLDAEFPAKALAKVRIILADGRRVEAPITAAPGGSDDPMSEDELQSKYMRYSAPVLGSARAQAIFASLEALDQSTDLAEFFGLLTGAV